MINREDIRAVSDYGSTNGQVFGVAPEYNQIRTVPVGTGRWFNDEDNTEHRRVAVVGWELLKNVFPGRPAVGATMLLNGIRFDIIGVLAKVGKDGNNGTNARIFVPVETMRNLFPLKAGEHRERAFLHQLPAAGQGRAPARPRRKFIRSSPAATDSIPSWKTPSKTGTQSRTRNAWTRYSMPWTIFSASWA